MKYLILLILSLQSFNLTAQENPRPRKIIMTPKSYPLVQQMTKKLNSTFRNDFGGASKTYIEITMPPLVKEWSYSFSTRKDGSAAQTLQLAAQISKLIAPFIPGGPIFQGLTQVALESIIIPHGEIPVNVYVMDINNMRAFMNNQPFNYFISTSATNATHATISIKNLKWGTYYIGIENYSWSKAVLLDIEAVAIVMERSVIQNNSR